MEDVQRLIGEVAKRHNVLVDPDDPIFIAVTLNELMLAEHVQKVQAVIEQGNENAALAAARQVENAKRAASQLLSSGAVYVSDQVRAAGSALRKDLEQLVRESMVARQKVMAEAARYWKGSQWAAAVAIACAGLALGTAVALWFGGR